MARPPLPADISATVRRALEEDIGSGDISAQLIPVLQTASARLHCKEDAVFCGIPWADEVFRQLDPAVRIDWRVRDGDAIRQGEVLASLHGNARSLLSGERCMLNFLQTLSGTATASRRLATLVAHTGVKLLDTRKTLPGLRTAQKFAVAVGGCFNHRMGLYDAFLIKENHIRACGSIGQAIENARKLHPQKPVEVEVVSLEELEQAIANRADIVMLDNFAPDAMRQAVQLNRGRVKLEASGGISQQNLASVAETGVDFISLGALTKDCKAVDLSLLFD